LWNTSKEKSDTTKEWLEVTIV